MDFGFSTFEVEIMVSSEQEIPEEEERIMDFAKRFGILGTPARGKL